MQASSKRNAKLWIKPIPHHWQHQMMCFSLIVTALSLLYLGAFNAIVYFCLMNAGLWSSSIHQEITKHGLHGRVFLARLLAAV